MTSISSPIESDQDTLTPEQQVAIDRLDTMVTTLQSGQSLPIVPQDTVEQTAVQFHGLLHDELDPQLDQFVTGAIRQQLDIQAHQSNTANDNPITISHAISHRRQWWMWFTAATTTAAVALFVVFLMNNPSNPTSIGEPTIASVQQTPSLTQAETLLAELPATATVDGVSLAAVRTQLHTIAQLRAQTNTTLDASATVFPHVQLRNSALTVIGNERTTLALLPAHLRDPAVAESITDFDAKVATWPTTNTGVSFDVHAKAVRAFDQHTGQWDQAMTAIVQQLIERYYQTQP